LKSARTETAGDVLKGRPSTDWTGKDAKESAISYGSERAKSDGSEVRVLNENGEVVRARHMN
jgi:flagellar hook assembly protein FlgD